MIYPSSFNKCDNLSLNVTEGTYGEKYAIDTGIAYITREYVDSVTASGSCGAQATWTLYQSGKMVIGGFGAMDNYTSKDTTPWAEYCMKITEVVIGKDITRVGNFAFAYAHNIKSVTFEEGSKLETIGAASFLYMLYTTEVIIPESVKTIGNNAFSYCKALTSVVIPQEVTLIYPLSFNKCDNIQLIVTADSYAEKYAITNSIAYIVK